MKSATRSIAVFLLALVLCFSLAGCGEDPYLSVLELVKGTLQGNADSLTRLLPPEYEALMASEGVTVESYAEEIVSSTADNPVTGVSYTVNSSEKITDIELSTVNSRRNMYTKDNIAIISATAGYRVDTTFTISHEDGQEELKYLVLYIICVDGNWYMDPLSLGF